MSSVTSAVNLGYDPREDREAQAWARNHVGDPDDHDSLARLAERERRERNVTKIPDYITDERLHFSQGTTRYNLDKDDYLPSKYYAQKAVDREVWSRIFYWPHEARDHKKNGPWFTQGLFERLDDRHAVTARVCYFLVYDVDDGTSFDVGEKVVRDLRIPCVITTTWSHQLSKNGVKCDRFRIIIPLRTPFAFHWIAWQDFDVVIPRSLRETGFLGFGVWPRMYMDIAAHLGLKVDSTCKDPSRVFYLPACSRETKHLARRQLIGVDEGWPFFDWKQYAAPAVQAQLDHLAKIAERKQRAAARREYGDEDADRDIDGEIKEIEAALMKIDPDLDYGTWRNVIFALHNGHGSGPLADTILDLIIAWSAGGTKFGDGTEEQIRRMWEAADPHGSVTMGTFWHIAKERGSHFKRTSAIKPPSTTIVLETEADRVAFVATQRRGRDFIASLRRR